MKTFDEELANALGVDTSPTQLVQKVVLTLTPGTAEIEITRLLVDERYVDGVREVIERRKP